MDFQNCAKVFERTFNSFATRPEMAPIKALIDKQ